jgi:hypothetical protein
MRSAVVHGGLLALALVLAWFVWTGEDSAEPEGILVWSEDVQDLRAITYTSDQRTLRVERRRGEGEDYLWGLETVPAEPPPALPEAGDSVMTRLEAGTARAEEADAREEETRSFPVGQFGEEVFEFFADLRVIRDLGLLEPERLAEYELAEDARTVEVETESAKRQLRLGGTVFAGPERYVLDPSTGVGYVLGGDMIRRLEVGMGAIRERSLHVYSPRDVSQATVRSALGERTMMREETQGVDPLWSSPDAPGEPDQTFGNFMARLDQLTVSDYVPDLAPDSLVFMLRADYRDEEGGSLGFLELYGMPAEGEAGPRYFVRTERTRILGEVFSALGERVEQDLDQVF